MICIRKNDIKCYGKGQADKKRRTEAERTKHGLRFTGRSAKPATIFRAGERESRRDSESNCDKKTVTEATPVKPKKGFRHKKPKPFKKPKQIKIGFSYEKGKNLKEADEALQRHKDTHKRLGHRHDRERDTAQTVSGRKSEGDKTTDERESDRSEKLRKPSEISEKVNPYEEKQQKFDFKFKEEKPAKGIPASRRVRMATSGRIAAASNKASSPMDIASLLAHIRKSAQEIAM